MRRQLGWLCILPALALIELIPVAGTSVPVLAATPDYPGATWVPASTANYSYANRPHDYPIQMIVIHDTETSYAGAIQLFQDPATQASAHYVVSNQGDITQMVQEKDIAWHAGNWSYNTRAIGIEHEGYVAYNGYNTAEYNASAQLAASICSRYGVPMDRTHVIGHDEVPDPNNPGLFGGSDHHTDPGPYWDWTYYMQQAQSDALKLPSPPRMMPDPIATNGVTSATVTWKPAQSCHSAITGYTVTSTPATVTMNLPATATSAAFNNLQPETSYTFTVTAIDADGQDSVTSNPAVPGRCNQPVLIASPGSGTTVQLTGTSANCANPLYQFWTVAPGATTWTLGRDYAATATYSWTTTGQTPGEYGFMLRVRDSNSPGNGSDSLGAYDASASTSYKVTPGVCTAVTLSAAPASSAPASTTITVTASAACRDANPQFQFVALWAGTNTWIAQQTYSSSTTWTWNSTGAPAGAERFGVWVKDSSSPNAYDHVASIPYTVTNQACTAASLTAAPASPSASGTTITVTTTATCPDANPQYEFWALWQGAGGWIMQRAYSTSNTWTWNSTGAHPGTERFGVWVKDASAATSTQADVYASIPYQLN